MPCFKLQLHKGGSTLKTCRTATTSYVPISSFGALARGHQARVEPLDYRSMVCAHARGTGHRLALAVMGTVVGSEALDHCLPSHGPSGAARHGHRQGHAL